MAQIDAEVVLDVEDRSSRDEFYTVDVMEVKKLVSDFARSDARSLNRARIDKLFGQKGRLFRRGSKELWWPDGSGVDQALTPNSISFLMRKDPRGRCGLATLMVTGRGG